MNTFKSRVISGHGRGQLLGFPTLNLTIPKGLTAKHGVYAGWVIVAGQRFPGAFHFGPLPVFASPKPVLEVFVLEHTFAPVPKVLSFSLNHYLRPVKNFPSPAALSAQIKQDVASTRRLLNLPQIS